MSSQTAPPPPLEVVSQILALRHDASAFRQFLPPGVSPRLPPKLGIGLPPLRDFVGHPIITPPWPGTPQAVILAAVAQERVAQRLINVVLDAVAPLDPASPLGNWRAVVIPLTSWTNGRVLGFVAPEDGVVVLPSAGQHGLPPESNAGDWRHVGLPPRLWIKIVIHEATHALQCRDFGNEPTNPEPDMHKLPGWRASCERLARALSGESLPDDIDVTYFPEGVGHFAPLIAQFEREVRHHLAPPRLLVHAECTPDRTVIDIEAETSRDVALGLIEPEMVLA